LQSKAAIGGVVYHYETILVGIDFTERSQLGLESACHLADRVGARRLHVVHVTNIPYYQNVLISPDAVPDVVPEHLVRTMMDSARRRLAELEIPVTRSTVTREVRYGIPARELTRVAEEVRADLLVVTSRGLTGLKRFVLGSLAGSLVRTVHCPILVLRDGQRLEAPTRQTMAAVDLSPVSANVLRHAAAMTAEGADLEVVSVFEAPLVSRTMTRADGPVAVDIEEEHQAQLERLVDETPHRGVKTHIEIIRKAPAAQVVVDVATLTSPDLLVVGTSGHNAWHRMLLGSTAHRTLTEVPCPVLIVPHDARGLVDDDEAEASHRMETARARS
jgi:nucleotide-binding universal stress UspA family protein